MPDHISRLLGLIGITAFEEYSRAKRARIESVDSFGVSIGQIRAQDQALVKSSSERAEAFTHKALLWVRNVFFRNDDIDQI